MQIIFPSFLRQRTARRPKFPRNPLIVEWSKKNTDVTKVKNEKKKDEYKKSSEGKRTQRGREMDKYVLQVEYRERENSDHSFSLPHCRSSRAIVCVDPTLHCEDKQHEGNAENGDGAAPQPATDGSRPRTGRLSRLTKRIYAMQESLKVHQKKKKKEKKKRRDKKRKKQQKSGIRLGATNDINRNFLEVLKQYKPYAEQQAQEKKQLFPKMKPLLLSDPPKPQDSSLSSALFAPATPPSLVGIDKHDNAGDGLSLERLPPATFFPNSRPNFSSTSSSSSMVSPSPSEAENFSIPFRSAPVTQPFYYHPYQAPCLLVPNNQDTPSPFAFFQTSPSSLSPLPHSAFHFAPFTTHTATNSLLLTPQHTPKDNLQVASNEQALESENGQEETDPMQTVPPLPQPIPQPREIAPTALGQVKHSQNFRSASPAPLSLAEQSPSESFGITLATAATPRPRARKPSLVKPKPHVAPVTATPAIHHQNNHLPSKVWKGTPRPFGEFEDARWMISATSIIDDAFNSSEPSSQQQDTSTLQQTIIHSKPPLSPYPIVTARQVLSQIDATSQVEKQVHLAPPPVTKMEDEKNEQKKSRPGWEKWLRWNAKEQARMNAANKLQQQTIPTNA
ncbi:hypothetical protein QOT17_010161 [Balamuthia mandrillaris]